MSRRNGTFLSSGSGFEDAVGVEIATEMAAGEPLRLPLQLITEHIIMSEYAMVCRDPVDGLYVVPSARDKLQWFGLLFIRRGVYAGAVFRFTLHLPTDFPSDELPKVVFDLDVFHPHVSPATRELDLKRYFVDGWKPNRYHIYHILLIVQRTFFTFDSDPTTCVNIEAATLLRDNKEAYRVRASELIKKSRSVIYDPVETNDANAIRLTPWDASIHEPLRQRLIGGLTDSQISTMSMLGSLGCGLNSSSVFESRGKYGFSWISPVDMCYMVEPPRPAELDLKTMSEVEEHPVNNAGPYNDSCPGELTDRSAVNENIAVQISKLDLSDLDADFELENEASQGKSRENDLSSLKNESSIEVIVKDEETGNPMEESREEREGKSQVTNLNLVPPREKSGRSRSECVESHWCNVTIANTLRTRSN